MNVTATPPLARKRLQLFAKPARVRLIEPLLVNEDTMALDLVLSSKTTRNKLLSLYMGSFELKSIANKIRCILAVDEFNKIVERVEKKQRGKKIVAMFVQVGSIYHVQDLPQQLTDELLGKEDGSKFFYFADMRSHCRSKLAVNLDVMDEVRALCRTTLSTVRIGT
ncbi:hypothetical protein BASA81_006431 [Batrachochytrium salamandrivorans]|nr:hypothetical protein BASA81_006431 [Batrachochytrium salamandrivorans]